jgi:hypothetical protein
MGRLFTHKIAIVRLPISYTSISKLDCVRKATAQMGRYSMRAIDLSRLCSVCRLKGR